MAYTKHTGIVYKVGNQEVESELNEHTMVDPSNLEQEYQEYSSLFGWYTTAAAIAENAAKAAKKDVETAYAQLYVQLKLDQTVKMTDAMTDAAVKSNPGYVAMVNKHLEAEGNYNLLRAACDAMRMKRDMIIHASSDRRAEMAANLRTPTQ